MVHFVGAGPGAVDLLTLRGKNLLEQASAVIYAGSLINKEILAFAKNAKLYDSAKMTLEEVVEVEKNLTEDQDCVRLHAGEPSIYGAIKEEMVELDKLGIQYDCTPGISALFGAAASINAEFTLPEISQSLVITRAEGRTPVPPKESLVSFAQHDCTYALFLSSTLSHRVRDDLIEGGMSPDTPVVIVYKATWEDEKVIRTDLQRLPSKMAENNISCLALILIGKVLGEINIPRSKLYDGSFTTAYREASHE